MSTITQLLKNQILKSVYPVGSIYINAGVDTNPGTLLGFGTWSAWGTGRVPVGVDTGQTEFNTVEKTGGDKTHTLTSTEMPTHTHTQNSHSHTIATTLRSSFVSGAPDIIYQYGTGGNGANSSQESGSTTATNQNTGGGGSHNNLQPYITCYFWKRVS